MATLLASQLEAINELSLVLLSHLDSELEALSSNKHNLANNEENTLSGERVARLETERRNLIMQLFEEHSSDEISNELILVNEMVSLNGHLVIKSQQNKKLLAEQLLKLKKSKKVTNTYKKY